MNIWVVTFEVDFEGIHGIYLFQSYESALKYVRGQTTVDGPWEDIWDTDSRLTWTNNNWSGYSIYEDEVSP